MVRLSCGHDVLDPADTHYCRYLHLETLTGLQPSPGDLRHPDEHLFVITHQSFELWFKEILFELEGVIQRLQADDAWGATALVRRVAVIVHWFPQQHAILETMPPPHFFQFRGKLAPASGLESQQFREIEILSGLRDPEYRRFLEQPIGTAEGQPQVSVWTESLERRWEGPSVREEFLRLLERRGVDVVGLHRPDADRDLLELEEALIDYDEAFATWRFAHARLAERFLGRDVEGTGQTTGVRYLDVVARTRTHFFPELWQARSALWKRMQEN